MGRLRKERTAAARRFVELSRECRQSAALGIVVVLSVLVWAPAAAADGGQRIATATPAAYGQLETGNTANGGQTPGGCSSIDQPAYRSWWGLRVIAGDWLKIDWSIQDPSTHVNLYPLAVNDFNLDDTVYPVAEQGNSDTQLMGELTYRVPRSGVMPLEFEADTGCMGTPGPYSFTAYVTHSMVVSTHVAGSSRRQHTTKFATHALTPEGRGLATPARYELQRRAGKKWVTAQVSHSSVFSHYWRRNQRGAWQYDRVRVSAPGYQTQTSQTMRVKAL